MRTISLPKRLLRKSWTARLTDVLLLAAVGSAMVLLLLLPLPFARPQLEVGDVAPQDIVAPRRMVYESDILTQQARDRAVQAVPDYYEPPQSRIRRQQVSRSREVMALIGGVREDDSLTPDVQLDQVLAIDDLVLATAQAQQTLRLPDEEWQEVVQEVSLVLDQVMREEIRENSMSAVRRRIPALVSPDLSDVQSALASELVRSLVRPNSFFNPERTDELKQQASESVPVQIQQLEQGEIILRAGDIVTPEDAEILSHLGLSQNAWSWWRAGQGLLFSFVLLGLAIVTIYRLRPHTLASRQETGLLILLFMLGLLAARLMIVPHDWLPYLFPLAALSMLAALLLEVQIAVVLTFAFSLIISYLSNGNVELVFYSTVGALVGALVLGKADRLTAFLWAGLAVIVGNAAVLAALWTQPLASTTAAELMRMLFYVLLNGGLSTSMALIGYFVLGSVFGITSNLQLMELSRPTHPLLRQLLLKAPGTYHHTILVSNLAERAAEAIGANAFLIRVGAYYHDIGKTVRPYFFTENISDDSSPHTGLDPETSAQIIISHVKDGVDLARKYRLPVALQDFIRQHHGAQLMSYFYHQAQEQGDETEDVDQAAFRYPGPDPQTKEAAIMMLADVCEAAVRAERPATRRDLEELVNKLITQRVLAGALNQCNLTFRELQTVQSIFVQVLQGVHHPRIQYPSVTADASGSAASSAVLIPPDTGVSNLPAPNGASASPIQKPDPTAH